MSEILDDPYVYKAYTGNSNSNVRDPFNPQTPGQQNNRDPNQLPSVDTRPGNSQFYSQSNSRAYDTDGMQQRLQQGVDTQSNLMGPAQDQSPEDQALSARAQQFYNSSLTKLARGSIPKSIAMTTKLQTQDLNNRSAIYADMQTRAAINYKEAIMEREKALGVAMMQRDLYGSLFGGLAKVGGSVAASAISTPSGSQSYYASNLTMPELNSGYSSTSGAPNLGVPGLDAAPGAAPPTLGMNYDFGEP